MFFTALHYFLLSSPDSMDGSEMHLRVSNHFREFFLKPMEIKVDTYT